MIRVSCNFPHVKHKRQVKFRARRSKTINYYHQNTSANIYRPSEKLLAHLCDCNGGITKSWYPLWTALIEGNEPDRSGCLLSTAAHDYTDPLLLHLTSLSPIAMVKLYSPSSVCVHITVFPQLLRHFLKPKMHFSEITPTKSNLQI